MPDGVLADYCVDGGALSADGRYVAFGFGDVFVRDRQSGTTERVSVAPDGTQANGSSFYPALSANGQFVAFVSDATNLVPGDTNGQSDVFVRDRLKSTTERVSVGPGGAQSNVYSGGFGLAISADGRFVAFSSYAKNLVTPKDTGGLLDVFVRDRQAGVTTRVSGRPNGLEADGDSGRYGLSISGDGRFVAFTSEADNLVPGDTNGVEDVFVHDRETGGDSAGQPRARRDAGQ